MPSVRSAAPKLVLKYLARYTHRVAISNSRLLDFEDGLVRFRYKDYAHGNRKRVMTLTASEFVRRLLLHVLPTGFVRIRHYGILSNRHRQEDLALCRQLLGGSRPPKRGHWSRWSSPRTPVSVTPTRVCPKCGAGRMIVIARVSPSALGEEVTVAGEAVRGRGYVRNREGGSGLLGLGGQPSSGAERGIPVPRGENPA